MERESRIIDLPWWRLQVDVAWGRALLVSGGPEPPPLAAASTPIPEAPSFTSAVGLARGGEGPDDAA